MLRWWGFIKIMVLDAFYSTNPGVDRPMSLAATASYVWLGQAFLGMLPWNVDRDVEDMVRTGAVAYELLRPLDAYGLWFARSLAWRTAVPLLRFIPMFVFAMGVLPMIGLGRWALALPPDPWAAVAWLMAQATALLLSCALTTLLNITVIWTLTGMGMRNLFPGLITVLCGMIVPLPLLPQGLQAVLRLLPFAYLVDVPFRLYTGHIPVSEAPGLIAAALAWAAALVLLGRHLMSRAMRRMVIQGG